MVQAREEHRVQGRQVGHVPGRTTVPMIGAHLALAPHQGSLHRRHLAGVQHVVDHREPVDVELGQRLFVIGHRGTSWHPAASSASGGNTSRTPQLAVELSGVLAVRAPTR